MTVIDPDDHLSQKKWIRDACASLIAALEQAPGPFYISPEEWKLIRDREPVGGCSDATEVFQARIAWYCRQFCGGLRTIAKGDCGSARQYTRDGLRQKERIPRVENAPGYMMVLTDWQTLSGPGRFLATYADVMDWTKQHPAALVWPTSGKITVDDVEWYFAEQPLPYGNTDFVLFAPPEATARGRKIVMRELEDYGGRGEVFPVTITERFGPQDIRW